MATLTSRQQQVLDFITDAQSHTGVIPSSREIQEHFKFASQTAAMNHLRALEKKGVIQRQAGKARAVAVVANLHREPVANIPLYGSIAAGMAELQEQEQDGTLVMGTETLGLGRGREVFALNVRGDSMIEAHINDGDMVVLEHKEPREGDIVAALIDGETTLKRFMVREGRPYLKAENPRFPELLPATELLVQGVLVALVRRYRGRNN